MTAILQAIGQFIGMILKAVLPDLIKEGKKPKEVKTIGHDKDLQDDINASIEDQINDE